MTSTSVAESALGENLPRHLKSPYTEVELETFGTHFTEKGFYKLCDIPIFKLGRTVLVISVK